MAKIVGLRGLFSLILCLMIGSVLSRLLTVQMLSRHGIRAPKASLESVCPSYGNWLSYDVEPEALTGSGMLHMYMLGVDAHARYMLDTKFLSPTYRYRSVYVRSSDSPRCMQSASAFCSGLYADGSGPMGYLASRPTHVPIHTEREDDDDMLDARKAHCRSRVKHDSREWLHQKGNTLINEHSDVVELMSRLCGLNLTEAVSGKSHQHQIHHTSHTHETLAHSHPHLPQASVPVHVPEHYHGDFSTAIKDIADALIFDQLQGFQPAMRELSPEYLERIHQFAFRMFYNRYFDTDEKIVYMSGRLPHTFVENFETMSSSSSTSKKGRLMYSYHTHRDMMYSFAEFFNLQFDGPGVMHVPGVKQGFIPPSTTLFLELHSVETSKPENEHENVVRVFLWMPCGHAHCPFTQIPIGRCGLDCPLQEFAEIVHDRERNTGTWMTLCSRISRGTLTSMTEHFRQLAQLSLLLLVLLALFGHKSWLLRTTVSVGAASLLARHLWFEWTGTNHL